MMTNDEMKTVLERYARDNGDDAVLPAVLLSLLKSEEQNLENLSAIKSSQEEQEKTAQKRMRTTLIAVAIAAVLIIATVVFLDYPLGQ